MASESVGVRMVTMRSCNFEQTMARAIRVLFCAVLVIVGMAAHSGDAAPTGSRAADQTSYVTYAVDRGGCIDAPSHQCGSSSDHDRVPSECSVGTCFLIMPRLLVGAVAANSVARPAPSLRDEVLDGRRCGRLDRPPRIA